MERVKNILVACVLVAMFAVLVTPAEAYLPRNSRWDGAVDSDWGNAANWYSTEQNEFYTVYERVDGPDAINLPVITAGVNATHGPMRMAEGITVTQTGGDVNIFNGADAEYSLAIFSRNAWTNGANYLNISGGSFTVWDGLGLGVDNNMNVRTTGFENVITVSGDGVLTLFDSENRPLRLGIEDGSRIEIADQGVFRVSLLPGGTVVEDYVDNLIALNKIVGIGNDVTGEVVGDYYVVSLIPEPATLALLGIGALAAFRRKR